MLVVVSYMNSDNVPRGGSAPRAGNKPVVLFHQMILCTFISALKWVLGCFQVLFALMGSVSQCSVAGKTVKGGRFESHV